MRRRDEIFRTIRSEGALLPADLLQRVSQGDKDFGGLRAEDYHVTDVPLNEAIVRSWNRLVGAWTSFRDAEAALPEEDLATTVTRERWLLVLFDELSYGRLQTQRAVAIAGKEYPVSHAWEDVPVHLVGSRVPLDRRSRGVAGAAGQNPHGLVQELLNRSEERLWGFVSNGLVLRLLRDNSSLTRQAYLEFDLQEMMESEAYADFVVLWLTCHVSRLEGERPHECWLERWSQEAQKQGTRALDNLRAGVERAITELGSGFLAHRANDALRSELRGGELSTHDFYRELLRLVYRLLFLFAAEDRALLHDLRSGELERGRYERHYSTRRLRRLGERRRGTAHGDLFEGLKLAMRALGKDEGEPALGLPALGSFLWSASAVPHLDAAKLANRDLLEAVRALCFVEERRVLRAVDYRNLGAEELGSVYESLLELHPEVNADAATFALTTAAGNERKTTGSYYTPTSLISVLLDSALDPVLEEAAAEGEEAILELKVCDPACGSGHFLVAAAHRIAKRLASVRTGDEEPSPEATRAALRDVVSRCLYGVDVNPMAVELCKVSLWMEALDPGRPLSFLDAHIRCGNSLRGTSAALMTDGIPDGAFKVLEGDDSDVAKALRKQNKAEREGQLTLEDAAIDLVSGLEDRVAALEAADDATVAGLHNKEQLFHDLLRSEAYERAKLAADAWCAAFLQRKVKDALRITTGVVRRIASGEGDVPDQLRDEIRRLAHEYALFHWEVEFPRVFGRPAGGFDVVLGNPPWERVKLQEREFFAATHPEIAQAGSKASREALIASLEVDDPEAYRAFRTASRRADGESHFVRTSGRYPLTGSGDVNTFALFAEAMRVLLSLEGRAGCIVPTAIATDDTTKAFFQDVVDKRALVSLLDIENRLRLFQDVDSRQKFCLLTLAGGGTRMSEAEFAFFTHDVADLSDPERRFTLKAEDFELLNPNTRTCPVFRTRRDAELTKSIYRRVPILMHAAQGRDGNQWGIRITRVFDMGKRESQALCVADEPHLPRSVFDSRGLAPMYEGKMFDAFDHRLADVMNVESAHRTGRAVDVHLNEKSDPHRFARPRYWIDARQTARCRAPDRDWVLGYMDVGSATNERTMIPAVLPAVGTDYSIRVLVELGTDETLDSCLLTSLGSFAYDYCVRQFIGGNHLSDYIIEQTPVLPPQTYRAQALWSDEQLSRWIARRALELTCTAHDLDAFASRHGYSAPFRWDPERRALLRAELDAAFFHLYGLKHVDVDYVMDTFPIVRRKDEQAHGEYRAKRLILEIYDELAEAIATGRPYQTRLDPPPADPRVAHPPRASDMSEDAAGQRRSLTTGGPLC